MALSNILKLWYNQFNMFINDFYSKIKHKISYLKSLKMSSCFSKTDIYFTKKNIKKYIYGFWYILNKLKIDSI